TEIIVPFDEWCLEVSELAAEFPGVRFHRISDLGPAADSGRTAHQHRLYDRRRAIGLSMVRGHLVAMTEDHAVPAPDWCRQITAVHEQSDYAAIGGAIENGVDRPTNWAWYYCDFGRYGGPLLAGPSPYASDVNISYKRDALQRIRSVWSDAYH